MLLYTLYIVYALKYLEIRINKNTNFKIRKFTYFTYRICVYIPYDYKKKFRFFERTSLFSSSFSLKISLELGVICF